MIFVGFVGGDFDWRLDPISISIFGGFVGGDFDWRLGPVGRFISGTLVISLLGLVHDLHYESYFPLLLFLIHDSFLMVLFKACHQFNLYFTRTRIFTLFVFVYF